jgi:hypothetical protein
VDERLAVLREQRGTCSTKHALLRRLAQEQGLEISLFVGIIEMGISNTPSARPVLGKYGLTMLPEAHCYLRTLGTRIDATRDYSADPQSKILTLIHEEEIAPEQIGEYKTGLHRRFLSEWIAQTDAAGGRTIDELWQIREECIRAFSNEARPS